MVTFDDNRTICQKLSGDVTAASLTFFDLMMNVGYKFILAELGRSVTERTQTAKTLAQQQYYQSPPNFLWLKDITVTVGGTTYPITEIVDQEEWNRLNMSTQYGDTPSYCFVRPNWGVGGLELGLWPIPSSGIAVSSITSSGLTATVTTATDHDLTTGDSVVIAGADQTEYNGTYTVTVTADTTFTYTFAGSATTPATGSITVNSNTINLIYESSDKDMSQSAYTTGTVTMTVGDDDVTGDSTVFITAMVGRYFKVTSVTGDGLWYRIASRSANTAIKLENYYTGASGATQNYTINEAFSLPEEMQILPSYYALAHYYHMKQNEKKALIYMGDGEPTDRSLFTSGIRSGKRRYGTKSRSAVIKKNPWMGIGSDYPFNFPSNIS
jgi:hypothetical protein